MNLDYTLGIHVNSTEAVKAQEIFLRMEEELRKSNIEVTHVYFRHERHSDQNVPTKPPTFHTSIEDAENKGYEKPPLERFPWPSDHLTTPAPVGVNKPNPPTLPGQ